MSEIGSVVGLVGREGSVAAERIPHILAEEGTGSLFRRYGTVRWCMLHTADWRRILVVRRFREMICSANPEG